MASVNQRILPADMCSEILSWLPAKEVARCRTIGMAFDVCSHDRHFFLTQSHHATADCGLFLRRHDGHFEMVLTDTCSGVPPSSVEFLQSDGKRILGSYGGLVLFDTTKDGHGGVGLVLFNPVRQTLLHLPRPEDVTLLNVASVCLAILFADRDASDMDYDVVCITPTPEWSSLVECWLYTSREKAWKLVSDRIHVGPRNIKLYSPVVATGGIIYLSSDCGRYQMHEPYIVEVNAGVGTSRILPLPEKLLQTERGEIEIARRGQGWGLSLVHYDGSSQFRIWDIKNMKRWVWEERGQVISMVSMGLRPTHVHGFSLINEDMLVFTVGEEVYVYNLKDGGEPRVIKGQQGCCPYMCSYANTFRPCGRSELGGIVKRAPSVDGTKEA